MQPTRGAHPVTALSSTCLGSKSPQTPQQPSIHNNFPKQAWKALEIYWLETRRQQSMAQQRWWAVPREGAGRDQQPVGTHQECPGTPSGEQTAFRFSSCLSRKIKKKINSESLWILSPKVLRQQVHLREVRRCLQLQTRHLQYKTIPHSHQATFPPQHSSASTLTSSPSNRPIFTQHPEEL